MKPRGKRLQPDVARSEAGRLESGIRGRRSEGPSGPQSPAAGDRESRSVPVRIGQHVEVVIEGLVAGGEAIGRLAGYAVFVPFGAPGDRLRVEIVSVKPGYARGVIRQILAPGPDRVEAPCPVFGRCGGCQWQHLAYGAQLEAKTGLVAEALARIAKLDASAVVRPTVGMARPWNYRNKAHWAIAPPPAPGRGRQAPNAGRPLLGLYEARSHRVVEPETCAIVHPVLNLVYDFLRHTLADFDLEVHDEATGRGWLRGAFAKIGYRTDQLMIGLVATSSHFPAAASFTEQVIDRFPAIDSLVLNINPARTNVLLGDRTEVLFGRSHLTERIGDRMFQLSARSFFQVNPLQTEVLYDKIRELASLTGKELVVDAFCGTGTISLVLAGDAAEVWGIEAEPAAVRDAEDNARANGVDHVHFLLGRVEQRLPRMVAEGLAPDVVVLDPPRKGCEEAVIAALAAARPARVVYVSCNPATLARDLAAFQEAGYRLEVVEPIDMFPQTAHVEAVALLVPGKRSAPRPSEQVAEEAPDRADA